MPQDHYGMHMLTLTEILSHSPLTDAIQNTLKANPSIAVYAVMAVQ